MSKIEVNQISSQCGSTLTIGQSGDTVTLAAGATQSGFGRTGTVDWDTTAKTASFTAVSGNGYFVNTTSGAITVTLPATPSAGDIVGIKDYAGTFATNNVTVGRNGSLIDGTTTDAPLSTNQLSVFFVYVDGTQGWKATQSDAGQYGAKFITATGGTILTCGDFKTHVFTSPGTFCVSCAGNPTGSTTVDYLVVAGGGGGGGGRNCVAPGAGAGSGAGGFRLSNGYALPAPTMSPLANPTGLPVTSQGYPITVGGGGAGGVPSATVNQGSIGNNSIFSTITSTGGGGGKSMGNLGCSPVPENGNPGGSGGGGGNPTGTAGAGNTPPVSPPQGNPGGAGAPDGRSSGGGGAGAAGSGGAGPHPGNGGDGSYLSDSFLGPTAPSYGTPGPVGSTRYFAGGGAGSAYNPQGYPAGTGGAGGGGNGATPPAQNAAGNAGTANTGGGSSPAQGGYLAGGEAGGSGIVIIRYKYQ